jgi:hypothetical protein
LFCQRLPFWTANGFEIIPLADLLKFKFANGKDIKSIGRPQKQVKNSVWPTE